MSDQDPLGLVGTTVGDKYSVERVVGAGGFAVVYRAMHLIWRRPVAIKAFRALRGIPEEDRQRLVDDFLREGALLAELSERSAAICQARDVGTITLPRGGWVPYLVLEWLEGQNLETVLQQERAAGVAPRTLANAMDLLEPAAEALALAHKRGIAHRDVKPANIFLVGDPLGEHTVKLLDFGIAKVVQAAQKKATAFGVTTGLSTSFTPAYGAAEQFSRSLGATGPWTDVFALALVMVELVTGRQPLEGEDLAQVGYAACDTARRPTPRSLGVDVTDEAEAVFRKALAVEPSERFADAGSFWSALRSAVGLAPLSTVSSSLVTAATLASRVAPFGAAPPQSGSAPTMLAAGSATGRGVQVADSRPAAVERPTAGSKSIPLVAGVLVLVVAGGAGAYALLHRTSDKPTAPSAAVSSAAAPAPASSASAAAASCPPGMIQIPGGKFFMGSDDNEDLEFERPAHQVALKPFCIDELEVTVEAFRACSDRGECKRAGTRNEWTGITVAERAAYDGECNGRDGDARKDHPVNCVDWAQADGFCKAEGKRLPTEAEWEFAARGPDGRKYPWGDALPGATFLNACGKECVAWARERKVEATPMYTEDDGWATTAPVGSFPKGKSRYGVQDVVGNVWEWVADYHAAYTADPANDPTGPASGKERVIRGGAWNGAYPAWVRPTFRYHDDPSKRSYGIGFRCARSLAP